MKLVNGEVWKLRRGYRRDYWDAVYRHEQLTEIYLTMRYINNVI